MAADTREPDTTQQKSSNSSTVTASQGKTYETFNISAKPGNANALPGGGMNTAGGIPREAGIIDAVRTVKLEEFKEVHKKPCVREALMTGIGAGFGVGGVRAIMGSPIFKACSWAVGTFCFGSFVMYEFCQRKRQLELQGLRRAAEVIDRKKTEKQIMAEEARAARRRAED